MIDFYLAISYFAMLIYLIIESVTKPTETSVVKWVFSLMAASILFPILICSWIIKLFKTTNN